MVNKIIKKNFFLLLLITLSSCGQDCNDIPNTFNDTEDAISTVLGANFKFNDYCNVSESSFITSANYYSCEGSTGYFIVGINNTKYFFQNVPFDIWKDFKAAESKGKFYNRKIRGSYRLRLNKK